MHQLRLFQVRVKGMIDTPRYRLEDGRLVWCGDGDSVPVAGQVAVAYDRVDGALLQYGPAACVADWMAGYRRRVRRSRQTARFADNLAVFHFAPFGPAVRTLNRILKTGDVGWLLRSLEKEGLASDA